MQGIVMHLCTYTILSIFRTTHGPCLKPAFSFLPCVFLFFYGQSHEMRMKEGDMYESDVLTFMAPRMSGWLLKRGHGIFPNWKRHWFVLVGGCLYYFHAPQDNDPRCIIPLDAVTVNDSITVAVVAVVVSNHQFPLFTKSVFS